MERDWQEAGGAAEDEGKPEQPSVPVPEERLKAPSWGGGGGPLEEQAGRQTMQGGTEEFRFTPRTPGQS